MITPAAAPARHGLWPLGSRKAGPPFQPFVLPQVRMPQPLRFSKAGDFDSPRQGDFAFLLTHPACETFPDAVEIPRPSNTAKDGAASVGVIQSAKTKRWASPQESMYSTPGKLNSKEWLLR